MAKGSYKKIDGKSLTPEEQKERMIEDIKGLFKVKEFISTTACQNVLDEISWKYTETGKNKNLCCPYWSEDAIKKYEENVENNKKINEGLVHEHVIPRNIFISTILKRIKEERKLTSEELEKIDERLIVCVIAEGEEENKHLPKNTMSGEEVGKDFFEIKDIWNRYRGKGIRVYEVKCKKEGRKTVLDLETKKNLI